MRNNITVEGVSLSFGVLFRGEASVPTQRVLNVTCDNTSIFFNATNWTGLNPTNMPSNITTVELEGFQLNITNEPMLLVENLSAGDHTMNFTVKIPDNQAPDSYNQTITVGAT